MADATDAINPSVEPVSDIFDLGVINTITKAPDYADALPEVKALKVTQWEENSRRLIQEYGQPDQISSILPKLAARAERERQRALGNDDHGLATLEALGTIRQSVGDDTSLPTQYGIFDNVQKTLFARAQDRVKSAQIKARDESAAASATYAKTVSELDNIGEALNRKTNSTWEETKAFGNVVGNAASRMFGDVTEAVLTGGGSVIYGSERPGRDRPLAYDPKATNKFLTRALIDQSPADLKEMSDRTGLDVSDPKVFNTVSDQFKSDFGRNEKAATVVSNGQILVNPEHAFSAADWDKAVDATNATPEAKAQAKARRIEIRDQLGRRVHEMIYDIGGYQDFAEAEFKKNPKISDGEMVEKYKESRGGIKKAWTSLKLGVKEGIAGLSQSIYGFAGMVAPKWAGKDWLTQTAMDAAHYAGQQGEIGKSVGSYGLLQDVTSGATSIAPYLVGGAALRVGKAAATTQQATMLATGFAHSAGAAYPEAYAALLASGKTREEAERLAKMEAVAAGAATVATMKLFPEGAAQTVMGLGTGKARTILGGMVRTGAHETGQEASEQLLQGLTKQQFSNPTGTAGGVMGESLHAGGVGGIVGALFGGANAASNVAENRAHANRIMDAAQAQAALAQQAGLPQTAAEIQALAQQAIAAFPVDEDRTISTKATITPSTDVQRQMAAADRITSQEAAATGREGVQAVIDKLGVTWDEAVQIKKDAKEYYFGPPAMVANVTRGAESPKVKAAWSDATTDAPITATWSNKDSDQPVKIVGVLGEKDGEVYLQTEGGTGIPASQVTRDTVPTATPTPTPVAEAAPAPALSTRGRVISKVLASQGIEPDTAQRIAGTMDSTLPADMASEVLRQKVLDEFRRIGGNTAPPRFYAETAEAYIAEGHSAEDAARYVEDAKAENARLREEMHAKNKALNLNDLANPATVAPVIAAPAAPTRLPIPPPRPDLSTAAPTEGDVFANVRQKPAPQRTPVPAPVEDLSTSAPTEGDVFADVQKEPTVAAAEADIATAKKASDAASDALFKAQETLADKKATLAAAKGTPSIAAKIQKKVDEQQAKVTKLAAEQQAAENAHRALLGLPEKTTAAEAAKVEAPKVAAPKVEAPVAPKEPKVRKPVVQAVKAVKPVEATPVAPKVEAPKAAEPVAPTPVAPEPAAPVTPTAPTTSAAPAKFNPQVGDKVYYQSPKASDLPIQVEVVAVNGNQYSTLSEKQRQYGMAPRVVSLSTLSDTPQKSEEAMRSAKAAKIVAARKAPKAEQETETKPESTKGDYTVSPQQTAKQLSASIAELVNKQTPAEREAAKEKWAAYLQLANPNATPKEIAARVSEMEKTAFPEKIEAVLNKQMSQGLNKVRNMLPAEQGNILMDVVSGPKGYMENLKNYGSPFVFLPEQGKTAGQIHADYSIAMNMKRQAGLEVSARTGKGGTEAITTPEEGAAFMNTPLPSAFNDLATDINAFKEEEITFEPPVPEHPALEGIPDAPADTTEAPAPVVELPVSEAAQKLADHVWDEYFAEPVEETIGAVIKRWGMTPEQAEYAIRRMLDLHMDMLTRQKGLDAAGRERSAFGRFTPGGNPVLVGGARAVELTKHTVNKATNETTYEHPDFHAFVRDEIFDRFATAFTGSLSRRRESAVQASESTSPKQAGTATKVKRSTIADDGRLTPLVPPTTVWKNKVTGEISQVAPVLSPDAYTALFNRELDSVVAGTKSKSQLMEGLGKIWAQTNLSYRAFLLELSTLAQQKGLQAEFTQLRELLNDTSEHERPWVDAVRKAKRGGQTSVSDWQTWLDAEKAETAEWERLVLADPSEKTQAARGMYTSGLISIRVLEDHLQKAKEYEAEGSSLWEKITQDTPNPALQSTTQEQSFASLRQDEVVTSVGATLNRIAELQRSGLLSAEGAARRRAEALQMLPQAARDLVNAAMDRFKLGTNVAEGLVATSKDDATSEPTRLLASALVKANPSLATTPLDIGMQDANEGGGFDPDSGAVSVNPIQHADRIGDTTVHEALHAIGLETVNHYLNEDFDKITPAQKEALDALSTLLESAQQQTLARDGITADTKEHPTLSGEALRAKVYGLTDLGEFINEVLTNEGFRTHLETLQAPEGTSFKGRLKNMWAAVRAALRKLFIGRDIDSTSLLAHAIDHALAFTQSVSDGSVGTVLDAGGSFVWSIGKLLKDNGRFGAAKSVRADGTMAEKDFEKAIERGNIPLAERDMLRTLVPEAFDKGVVNVRLLEELLPQRKPIVSFTYGMDGEVSAEKAEMDRLGAELDMDPTPGLRDVTLSGSRRAFLNRSNTPEGRARFYPDLTDEQHAKVVRYDELARLVLNEPAVTGPRATSAYNSVSSIDPAALKAAGGESIKISVALPSNGLSAVEEARYQKLMEIADSELAHPKEFRELTDTEEEELNKLAARRTKEGSGVLHYADDLHESGIRNTLGWAWLHVVPRSFLETWAPHTLAKGGVFEGLAADGKVMLLDEQQSAWGQSRRDALEKSKRADNNEWSREEYKKSVADHPLLDVQHYLVLKQAIAEADKRGITLFAAPDSETAMQTEMHDQLRSDSIGRYDTLQEAQAALQQAKIDFAHDGGEHPDYADYTIWMVKEGNEFVIRRGHAYPTQADGMDIHYNTTIQSALRNLTGDAGTPAALGVHKNTETDYEQQSQVFSSREAAEQWRKQNDPTWVVRERFLGDFGDTLSWTVDKPVSKGSPVFKDAQGNPKKDVTVTVYDLRQAQATMHKQGGFTLASKRRSTLPNRVQSKPLDEANSTALRSVWDRLPAHLKQQVKYQPTTEDADFDAAGKWLNENPRTPADQLDFLLGNGDASLLGLTGREKIAAVTLSLVHLQKIAADFDNMNPADITEDSQQARNELGAQISAKYKEFTSLSGNMGGNLQAIHMAQKKLLAASPELFVQSAYVEPAQKIQETELVGNKDAKAVKAAVKKAKATAAVRATDRMTGVFAKLMQRYLGDQAQTTFDFFNDVIGIPASQQARTLEERKAALVDLMTDRLATQLRLHGMLNDQTNQNPTEAQQEAMNRMIADVRREVASQIDRVMASDAGTNTTETPEQRSERLLSQAAAAFGRSDMAAQVFDAAKQRIMALRENSLPEIQKIIDERVASAQFDPAQIKKFSTAIKQLADFRTMARSSYQSQEKTRVALAEQIAAQAEREGTPMSDAQKAQLRTVLETVFNAEMASAVQDEIAALKKRYLSEKKSPINELDPVRLTRLFAQGAMSDAELYNAIAPAFNLPAYDPALVKAFTDQARAVKAMPEGSVMADDAQTALMKEIGRAHRRQAVGPAKRLYRFHIWDSLWVSGALMGPPTHVVNVTMTAANVFFDLYHHAHAQYQHAVRNGADKTAARQFFTDAIRAWRLAYTQGPALADLAATGKDKLGSVWNSPALLEMRAAMTTGATRKSTEVSDSIMPLEYYDLDVAPTAEELKNPLKFAAYTSRRWLALNKYVGRALLAEDSLNRIVARSGAELMYMRAALLEDAETGHKRTAEEMKDLMQPFVSPTSADVESLRAQVNKEEEAGHFDHIPENRREFMKNRRFAELRNRRFDAKVRSDAEAFAAKATFNNDAQGVLGMILVGGFGSIINKMPGPWGRIIVPFPRIIANLFNNGLDYTPYGFMRAHNMSFSTLSQMVSPDSKYAWQEIKPPSVEYFEAMSKAIHGTMFYTALIGLLGAALLSDPDDPWLDITGDGPDDYAVLKQLEQNRDGKNNPTWVKNSIKVRIGDKTRWLRHSDFPGISLGLAALGAIRDAWHYEKEKLDKQHLGLTGPMLGGIMRSLLGKNMLSGALDFVTAVGKGGTPEGGMAGSRLAGSLLSGVTYPQGIKFAQNALMSPVDMRDQSRTWGGWLIAQTPLLPWMGRPAFNILGEPLKGKFYDQTVGRVLPVGGGDPVGHPIIGPLTDAGINIPVPSAFKLKDGTELTKNDPQFYDFSLKYGQTMKSMLTPQVVQQLVNISKAQGKDAANKAISSFAGRAATRAAQMHVYPMLPRPAKP